MKKATSAHGATIKIEHFSLVLVGTSPLIVHAWSEKAKQMMRDTQQKKPKQAKEARNPENDYLESRYIIDETRDGFPIVGFKSAAVDACSHIDGLTKVEARGAFHLVNGIPSTKHSDLVPIQYQEMRMREDMVRVGMGAADLRYRAEYTGWTALLKVKHNANVLSREQIENLFGVAGFAIGVGEWRPAKDGSNGMFEVQQ
jgi:hypothetical protein